MKNKAVGFIEVQGLTAALVAGDAAAKAGNIEIIALDSTKPQGGEIPLTVQIKIIGDVSSVTASVEAARQAAAPICGEVITHVISKSSEGLEALIKQGNVGK